MSPGSARDACFDNDWLTLREPMDHASRARAPTRAASRWLTGCDAPMHRIVDLGSGSGSNPRYLAPRLPGPQHWTLVDHDAGLLTRARRRTTALTDAGGVPVEIETVVADLDAFDAAPLAASLMTAAALFDLVTASWIDRLAAACRAAGCGFLGALSVDGRIDFRAGGTSVSDADDRFVLGCLAEHQNRDKGLGAALGPDAPAALAAAFQHHGFTLVDGASDWRLDARAAALAAALIDGWRDAATTQAPDAEHTIAAWAARRRGHVATGTAELVVGHRDLFAAPPRP